MTKAATCSASAKGHFFGSFTALIVLSALGLGGCGSISERTAATAFVAPGRYSIYQCHDLDNRIRSAQNRVLELEQLMARTAQGTGGQFINAIAYQSEYAHTRGQLKAMSDTAADKNCASQSQWSSQRSVF
jgi:hypothetical protein